MKRYKWLFGFMAALIILLQYHLWLGDGGLLEYRAVKYRVANMAQSNAQLRERNEQLEAEVYDLKSGLAAIEERARNDLGMLRKNEHFIWVPQQQTP